MNKLTFSSETPFKGSAIGDLQEAIHLLLDRGVLLTNDEAVRVELSALLTKERAGRTNGYDTRKLVGVFQQERGLEVSGEVDEPTTEALNAALRELLGPQAHQAGSYNKAGYMRLDFNWNQALSPATRSEIEEVSNTAIRSNLEV